ncbi:5'/3'-nucleotidase SurE [Candidatus Magnetominusculus xianensis]|uniref:5'-nucleotidase SurE n=1 Tax=Candidatus Magnetominusculus xianensis TaxID=1748249 RepID=A0ABR5SCP0_9BACT|nr:5'/3'-nucleotidase SurE [Candidatus Magnetominusculus xianensis]KWT82060.1 stationary phase survival protein SurE [Candidatus Magnetominusculus xianensis]MBF0405654.1 5'/3'-nucleotidase SurE [Nitrospirota bacterium]
MALILVTNDDGVLSEGLTALFEAMSGVAEAVIVAPDTERSATSHSLTMHRPLRVTEVRENVYAINGTPTDCVTLGIGKILKCKPDLVASGINKGGNLGDDITYSGTVSAAIEGTILGVPSFAISMLWDDSGFHFNTAAAFAKKIAMNIIGKGLPRDTLLNVNVPNTSSIRGVKFTKQGKRVYCNSIQETYDPWGKKHFWIGGGSPSWEEDENTDFLAVESGYISVTPLHLDLTNYDALKNIKNEWKEL